MAKQWLRCVVSTAMLFGVIAVNAADAPTGVSGNNVEMGYYEALAREGSADAQLVLGDYYRELGGGEKNLIESYAWYYAAAHQGIEEAVTPMVEVLNQLNEEQQHRAKELAEEYATRYIR